MCEVSYIEINTICGILYITFVRDNDITYPIRISFKEPDSLEMPANINYSKFVPENNIPMSKIIQAIHNSLSNIGSDFKSISLLKFYSFSPFQNEVYKQLLKIERSKTVSYQQLAILAGKRNAARAVGNIMNKNPYLILIPCHRVIKSDGSVGGFGGNSNLKEFLLANEQIHSKDGIISIIKNK